MTGALMALPRSEPDVRYDIRSLQSARPSNARDGAAGQVNFCAKRQSCLTPEAGRTISFISET